VRRRPWRWLLPLTAVPVLALLAYGFRVNPRDIPSPLVGRPAAPFALTSFEGAPWCYPACYEEAPVLERGWRAYRDRDVVVLGVDIQDKDEAGRKFIREFSLTFPNAPDPSGKVSVDYGVYGVPETFFIDRAGAIRVKHVSAVTDQVFRDTVEALLAEPAPRR
jgi:peroxiredoxin